jgi:nucleoid-associated protein YgaU
MKKSYTLFGLVFIFILSGCVVRTYQTVKDRVDQDLTGGNRGYLKGQAPKYEATSERKTTRTTQVVEIELHSPIKFEKKPKEEPTGKPKEKTQDQTLWGNQGIISREPQVMPTEKVTSEKYTVQKNDTLQKISQKFFGTTKKWNKIYELNKDKLKGPDKIYPGQVIDIPVEPLKETKENLK